MRHVAERILLWWISAAALGLAAMDTPAAGDEPATKVAEVLQQRYPRTVEDLQTLQNQVQAVSLLAVPATVEIEIGQNVGSGVVVSRAGIVLSAAHVLGKPGLKATVVLPDGRKLEGTTLGTHHLLDIGMLQIKEPPADLPFVPPAPLEELQLGEWVVATGQPGGILDNRSPPVRLGRILASGGSWICTDCTLVGGDSGGPLFNMRGEVCAIHTSIGPRLTYNFHVPISEFHTFWDRLLAGQEWGSQYLDHEHPERDVMLGIAGHWKEDGCEVTQVFAGYPAETAGLRPGDRILALDQEQLDSMEELARLVRAKDLGQRVVCQYRRAGQVLEVDVLLDSLAQDFPGAFDPNSQSTESDGSTEER